jgi:hypothetical protein
MDNKKPLSDLPAEAAQPKGAVLGAIWGLFRVNATHKNYGHNLAIAINYS